MARKKNKRKKNKRQVSKKREFASFSLSDETKRYIFGVVFFAIAAIFSLSFFEKAGIAGKFLFNFSSLLTGKAVFMLPFIFVLSGLAFLKSRYKEVLKALILAILICIVGISGVLESWKQGEMKGGWIGYIFTWPFLKFFDVWVTRVVFSFILLSGGLIFRHLLIEPGSKEKPSLEPEKKKSSWMKKIFSSAPSFQTQTIEPKPVKKEKKIIKEPPLEFKAKPLKRRVSVFEKYYKTPPFDLLGLTKEKPSGGDVETNMAIIKKTLESFDIPVEMADYRVGPTVTQYSLKPAEGIKLSRITSLANDLALALATHPIRIEAPIPGKSLVGVEVPNKVRSFVRLRELIENPQFQNSPYNLTFCLGKDVAGTPVYTNLERMPHLLVAGSTGTGKTIFLNSLILSLIYRNSPDSLKFLLIDPKRVEFTVYHELPHLLCPPIVESSRAVNALKWLIGEMERRFKLLAEKKSRNILSYNRKALDNKSEYLPYIVLIVDELADLMVAKGRDVETAIVRLAQMARAVGIHLVVATQRPSVEVITGLIKANITSRVTFQVASQVDSRTVLDMAGAERLLGLGDMLFISNEIVKPKRIQGAYVSEKEVKKVVEWIKSSYEEALGEEASEDESLKQDLAEALDRDLEAHQDGFEETGSVDDPLYEEAKRVILQYRRASASLLQRKLRIGYARAARIIDMLEEKGVVGPSRGAKPREIYISEADENSSGDFQEYQDENDEWQAV